jgi:predicted lipid carrier protein YhbT
LANDLELVLGLINVIDVYEISVLASKLRAADGNLQQMVAAIFEHNHSVRTLKSVTTTNGI